MTTTVELPLWLLILVLGFAAVTALDRVLVPSVRWFFRRRMEHAVAQLNARLQRPIQPFKLARRHDMIQRLIYDPGVAEAIAEHARKTGVPENVAFGTARRYAREIVPGFSATAYFGIAIRAARRLSRTLYDVRVAGEDTALEGIDPEATIVFVVNHRSNMDYVLVTWLAAQRSALSYAVGEWARIWPLAPLIRAMGAYFIRRRTREGLYRRVLSRYVQLATAAGVTQAIFPEGGLTLDGRLARPRLGLLSYLVEGGVASGRDVVFVPVAVNYDRVLEDRILTEAGRTGTRRFRAPPATLLRFVARQLRLRLLGRWHRFGRAGVSFGEPLSLARFRAAVATPRPDALAAELMARIAAVMPILPVPLVASILHEAGRPMPRSELVGRVEALVPRLAARGAPLLLPDTPAAALTEGLAALERRGLVFHGPAGVQVRPENTALIAFYAHSVAHLCDLPAPSLPQMPSTA